MGQVVGPDIDLRLFMDHWEFGFAVTDETEEGPRRSLQFFDRDGTAVHKIYLTAESDVAMWSSLRVNPTVIRIIVSARNN